MSGIKVLRAQSVIDEEERSEKLREERAKRDQAARESTREQLRQRHAADEAERMRPNGGSMSWTSR